jgi:hypothetical protein
MSNLYSFGDTTLQQDVQVEVEVESLENFVEFPVFDLELKTWFITQEIENKE